MDVGLIDDEWRADFQRELASLRAAAPPVAFKEMRAVIESELEDPLDGIFETFDQVPVAAASIGQVYKATLRNDGREVAVKVQYPGVAAAVRADLRTMTMLRRPLSRIMAGADVDALLSEISDRLSEELDYEMEAQNQRSIARLYDGHPFILVPRVMTSLCRDRVLVTEFITGEGFEALKHRQQAQRDRIGEILFRFFLGSLYRHRQFSGDPHPGNYLLLEDGRVGFLDFGLFKRMDETSVQLEIGFQRVVAENDPSTLRRLLVDAEFLTDTEQLDSGAWMQFLNDVLWWYASADEVLELTPEIARRVITENADPRTARFAAVVDHGIRAEHLFGRRMEALTLASIAQLRSRANWHRIAREWMYGEEPVSPLGREEARFYASVGLASSA
jgi:predicted unusual protein kinase regulating ubiquinone biosynthesis (AarF/ABC1/UbiB family)